MGRGRRYLGLELLAKARLVLITTETTQEAPTLGAISAYQTTTNHKTSYTTSRDLTRHKWRGALQTPRRCLSCRPLAR